MVDLLENVEVVLGKGIGDLCQHTRNVLVNDSHADGFGRTFGEGRGWEIDRVANGSVFEIVANGVGGHGGGLVFGFFRGCAQVWQNDGIRMIPKGIVREIGHVACVGGSIQKGLHGVGIYQFATGKIQNNGVALQVTNNICSNNTVSSTFSFDVRDIERYVISSGYSGCNRILELNDTRKLKGRCNRKTRIVSYNLHSQSIGTISCCHATNISQSNDSNCFPHEFSSTKHGLVFFYPFLGQTLFTQTFHVVDSIDDATASQKHSTKNQFLDGVGIGTRCVEYWNTQFRHASYGNVVGSGATTSNGTNHERNFFFLEFVGTQQQGVAFLCGIHCVQILVETIETNG
mmetsp:Transcript_30497/g.46693  ORF Transcript_30497/g.46693 Transcript_30497/m.46693 type:complete len:345 (+) Transcript_30497:406-1440(+)